MSLIVKMISGTLKLPFQILNDTIEGVVDGAKEIEKESEKLIEKAENILDKLTGVK